MTQMDYAGSNAMLPAALLSLASGRGTRLAAASNNCLIH